MKCLITSEGNISKSKLDLRFVRSAWFCINCNVPLDFCSTNTFM